MSMVSIVVILDCMVKVSINSIIFKVLKIIVSVLMGFFLLVNLLL